MAPPLPPASAPFWQRAGALCATTAALLGLLFGAARPWYSSWGSNAEERQARPAVAVSRGLEAREVRAVSIAAPADQVFAWVAQLGQDRAGFYSYDVLENLAGCRMPRIERLDPALQQWSLGQRLWMYPADELGGAGHATLVQYEPGQTLVFETRAPGDDTSAPASGLWSMAVRSTGPDSSRLVVSGFGSSPPSLLGAAFNWTVFEPMHFAMERRMLRGIAGLAEGRPIAASDDALTVSLWAVTFAVFAASAALVLLGRRWRARLASFAAAGLVFQLLTLGQPAPFIGLPLVVALVLLAWAPRRELAERLKRLEPVI